MNDRVRKLLAQPAASVPAVGREFYNLSRNGSYEAAKRGDFPTVKVGRRMVVPTAWLKKTFQIEGAE